VFLVSFAVKLFIYRQDAKVIAKNAKILIYNAIFAGDLYHKLLTTLLIPFFISATLKFISNPNLHPDNLR